MAKAATLSQRDTFTQDKILSRHFKFDLIFDYMTMKETVTDVDTSL